SPRADAPLRGARAEDGTTREVAGRSVDARGTDVGLDAQRQYQVHPMRPEVGGGPAEDLERGRDGGAHAPVLRERELAGEIRRADSMRRQPRRIVDVIVGHADAELS